MVLGWFSSLDKNKKWSTYFPTCTARSLDQTRLLTFTVFINRHEFTHSIEDQSRLSSWTTSLRRRICWAAQDSRRRWSSSRWSSPLLAPLDCIALRLFQNLRKTARTSTGYVVPRILGPLFPEAPTVKHWCLHVSTSSSRTRLFTRLEQDQSEKSEG